MGITEMKLKGLIPLITPHRFGDLRGFFAETYSRHKYADMGIDIEFVQDNHSLSRDVGTLRGSLHDPSIAITVAKLVLPVPGGPAKIKFPTRFSRINLGSRHPLPNK